MALITKDAPHLLILDEPTNHLDIQSRDALLDALNAYTGAVVLITHDLHVIEMACDTLWIVRDGTCRTFTGDLEDYKMQLLNGGDREGAASDKMSGKEARRRDAAKRRADAAPLKKQIRELDKRMEKLSTRKAQLVQQLLVQYSADGSIELALLTDELNKCEEEWLALNEQCEALLHAD